MLPALFLAALCVGLGAAQTTAVGCPAALTQDNTLQAVNGTCYQFNVAKRVTHTAAKADCEKNSGTLVLIKSAEIQNYIYTELRNTYHLSYNLIWIGLNDLETENTFKWEDGTALTYSNWDDGEGPTGGSLSHIFNHEHNDCVLLDVGYGGKWAEYPCESANYILWTDVEEHGYVCQYPIASA